MSSGEIPTNNPSDNPTIADGYNFGKTPIKDPTKDGEIEHEYPVKMVSDSAYQDEYNLKRLV